MSSPNFVSAIVRCDIENKPHILMIEVHPDDVDSPFWTLPGGRVEKGETGVQAAIRETHEETGVTITGLETVAYYVQVNFDDIETYAEIYVTDQWQGQLNPNDPDGLSQRAAWMPLADAIAHLEKIDYTPMSEPPVAFLSGTAANGRQWHYRANGHGAVWVKNV